MKTKLTLLTILFFGIGLISFSQPSDATAIAEVKKRLLNEGDYSAISSIKVTKREKIWDKVKDRWDYNIYMRAEGTEILKIAGLKVRTEGEVGAVYNINGGSYSFRSHWVGFTFPQDPIPAPDKSKFEKVLTEAFISGISESPNSYPFKSIQFSGSEKPIQYGNKGLYAGKSYQWTDKDRAFRSMYNYEYVILCKEENPRDQWDEFRPTYTYYETTVKGVDAYYLKWNDKNSRYEFKETISSLMGCYATVPKDNGEGHVNSLDRKKITKDEYQIGLSQTLGRSDAEKANAAKAFAKPSIPSSFKTTFSSEQELADYVYQTIISTSDADGMEQFLKMYLGDYFKSEGYQLNAQGKERVDIVTKGITDGSFKAQYCKEYPTYVRGTENNWQNLNSAKGYAAKWFTVTCAKNAEGFYIKSLITPIMSTSNQLINCDGTKFTGQSSTTNSSTNTTTAPAVEADEFQVGDKVWVEFSGGKKYEGVITRGKDKWNKTYKVEVKGKVYDTHPEFITKR